MELELLLLAGINQIHESLFASDLFIVPDFGTHLDCPIDTIQHNIGTSNMIYNLDFYQLSLCKPCSTMV